MGACTHIKENILCVWGKKNKEMKDERHPDRDSYLKEHFGWNRNLEQSQLKCELSSGEGIKGERERDGGEKWHWEKNKTKKQIPQEQPPGGACVADGGRTKAYQMDHSNHFQLCIKVGPPPKVWAVNGKQQTACDCFHELSEMEPHATERQWLQTKQNKKTLLFMSA